MLTKADGTVQTRPATRELYQARWLPAGGALGSGVEGGVCAHSFLNCNKPWHCVSPPGVFSWPLCVALCLWFKVARNRARAINRTWRVRGYLRGIRERYLAIGGTLSARSG